MGTRTSHAPGTFSWVDLQTTDPAAAKSFYGSLFGWEYNEQPIDDQGGTYAMALVGGESVAAIAPMPPGAQFPPHWNSYVTVESADDISATAQDAGGATPMEPFDVFEAGRMAVVADPTGAVLCCWEPKENIGAGRVNEPGCLTWNELGTKDTATAAKFYGDLFGWTYEEMDMGTGDAYRIVKNGERSNGGIRAQSEMEAGVPPNWLAYFVTEDIEASAAKAVELGGQMLAPPMEIPMGSKIAVVADGQGAAFALFEGDTDD
jgi:predicted enzyme related to lactoylglutathione lyase